jgi:hypothetical protein
MLSLRYSTIMYFVFLTNAVAAYLMPLDLVKDERLVLVRNGEKIEFWPRLSSAVVSIQKYSLAGTFLHTRRFERESVS